MDGLLVMGIVCAVAVVVILVAYATRRKPRPPEGAVPGREAPQRPIPTTREGGDGGGASDG